MRLANPGLPLLFAALVSTASAVAAAQSQPSGPAWLSDRSRVEGPGIRRGRLELHPGIGVEVGWDSNVFLRSGGFDGDPQPSAILRVTPHFYLSTLGEQRRGTGERRGAPEELRFRGGVSGSYYEYFAFPDQRNLSGDLTLRLDFLPESTWQFSLFEDFSRGVRPFTNGPALTSFARDRNRVGAEVGFAPHGGTLEYRLGYAFGLDLFEDSAFAPANNLTHDVFLRGRWRFLPKTALAYDATLTVRGYTDPSSSLTVLSDSTTIATRIGLQGLVSSRVSITLTVGYMAGFYATGPDLENISGQVDLAWAYSPFGRLRLGYLRDSQNAYFGNFTNRDQGSISLQHMIAGRFLLGVEGSATYIAFARPVLSSGAVSTSRHDVLVRGFLSAEYRATDWFGITLSGGYTGNITSFQYQIPDMMGRSTLDPAEYTKLEVWLGVRANY